MAWIEHDGRRPDIPDGARLSVKVKGREGLIVPGSGGITINNPGFYWAWVKVPVGWFGRKLIRVCDLPEYMPIVAYRINGGVKIGATALLDRIVKNPKGVVIYDPENPMAFPKQPSDA